jgi:hypothetical protein
MITMAAMAAFLMIARQTPAQSTACDSIPVVSPGIPLELAGGWTFEFIADTGRRTGRKMRADMRLITTTDRQRSGTDILGRPFIDSAYVFWGTLSSDLRRVGALQAGDVRSRDSLVPGVRVYARRERPGTPPFLDLTIDLRPPPPHDHWQTVLDGAYTTLFVTRAGRDGLAGRWESGGGEMAIAARGRFCGRRLPSSRRRRPA